MENKYFMKSILIIIQVQCAYLNVFIFQVHRDDIGTSPPPSGDITPALFSLLRRSSCEKNSPNEYIGQGFFQKTSSRVCYFKNIGKNVEKVGKFDENWVNFFEKLVISF